jgi:hypothetical protein
MHPDKIKPGAASHDAHRVKQDEIRTPQNLRNEAGSATPFSINRLRLNASIDSSLERLDRARKSTQARWPIEKAERVVELRIQRQARLARLALLNPSVESLPLELARLSVTAQGRHANG